ncbi:MAG: hypothetical protein QM296_05500 [Bacillota bacterium]|nr:hypothetical protein [Bacillota bacterium]
MVISCIADPQRAETRIRTGLSLAESLDTDLVVLTSVRPGDARSIARQLSSAAIDSLLDICRELRVELQLFCSDDQLEPISGWVDEQLAAGETIDAVLIGEPGIFMKSGFLDRFQRRHPELPVYQVDDSGIMKPVQQERFLA